MKPPRDTPNRDKHIAMAKRAKYTFASFLGYDDRSKRVPWNPFKCNFKVNGWVWISCKRNDKYGRTLVFVYKNRRDMVSINKKMIDTGFVNAYDGGTKQEFDL